MIPWHDILEDETVKLPAPKNIYSEDIVISTDVAIFAASKSPIKQRGSYNASDDREIEMMIARWRNYEFRQQFSPQEQKKSACLPKMFCKINIF